jgi:hypothetical protein
MRRLMILACLALAACLPAIPGRLSEAFSGDYPRLLNQSELEALWIGPTETRIDAPDLTDGMATRLAALEARAAILRAYRFDNSALQ